MQPSKVQPSEMQPSEAQPANPLNMDDIVRRVRRQARGRLDDVEITRESTITDLGLSSLELVDVVFGIEDDFGLEFDEVGAADLVTIGELLDFVSAAQR